MLGGSTSPAAMAGYPQINVPMGYSFGLPSGMSFIGTAWSEPTLIKLASGYEAVTHHRKPPTYLEDLLPNDNLPPGGQAELSKPIDKTALLELTQQTQPGLRLGGRW